MAMKKTQLIETHPLWKAHIKDYEFLMNSYLGGISYKEGEYLTSYIYESREEYEERLENTALDNHVKSVVAIYNSFLFRIDPKRDFGTLNNDPALPSFLEDADLDGRSFNVLMRDISTYASIYGMCWAIIDKPSTNAQTRAEELNQEIRPYISLVTPDNVLDWEYARASNGAYYLTYLKIYEGNLNGRDVFRVYTPDTIIVMSVTGSDENAIVDEEYVNALGSVPAVPVYSQRSGERGVGVSDVGDVSRMQRAIYNELSELEQLERISNHPSLVKTPGVRAHAGAGALIDVPEDTPGDLKPYLLQPSGGSIDSLLNSINQKVSAIDRMSHMGGIRSIESRRLSGVALATEFQLLNARLAEKADNLEYAEELIWRIYAQWQGTVWNGSVKYPDSFNIQDQYNDVVMLKTAKEAAPSSPIINKEIDNLLLKTLVSEERFDELTTQPQLDAVVHTPVNSAPELVKHLKEMFEAGYTEQQILDLHPEIPELFVETETFTPLED